MAEDLMIRLAEPRDMKNVFELSNDDTVRAVSIHPEKIEWEKHIKWFESTLKNPDILFYVAETAGGDFIGQLRFSRDNADWLVSISLVKKYRGHGVGPSILKQAMQKSCLRTFTAYVGERNATAQKMFLSLGYKCTGTKEINKKTYNVFEYISDSVLSETAPDHRSGKESAENIFRPLKINILTAKSSWMNRFDETLKTELENRGHTVNFISSKTELEKADISFFLSCFEIIGPEYLEKSDHNIVVHASDLPHGKGWSPTSWQILEGKNEIPLTLFEAIEAVDAGRVYLKDRIRLDGFELIDKWQSLLGDKIVEMCLRFTDAYPDIVLEGKEQTGEESFYPRRRPKDSELDINKTIADQFNLLRIVDNEKYPAFFIKNGKKYLLKIYEDKNDE